MTLEEKLSELKAKAEKATPGPFDIERRDDDCGYMNYIVHGATGDYAWCRDELDPAAKQNAAFVAATNRAVVLALVEVAMRCHRLNSVLDSALQDGDTVICRGPAMRDVDAALASLDAALGEVGGE